jgi:hypothetical protein
MVFAFLSDDQKQEAESRSQVGRLPKPLGERLSGSERWRGNGTGDAGGKDEADRVDYTLGCEIRTKLVVSLYDIPRLQS